MHEQLDVRVQELARETVDAAIKVHRALGPGLLESVYEKCLSHELRKRGVQLKTQVVLPIMYDGEKIESGLRLDMIVADQLIVEIKAVETLLPVHRAQILTYLKLTGLRLGLLLNFNVPLMKDGIERIIN